MVAGCGDGWEWLRAGEWGQARAAFETALANGETSAVLDGLARSRWWLGDVPGAIDAWERAYAAYRREGDDAAAARVGLLLAKEHGQTLGNHAVANGWLARSRSLVDALPPSPVQGWVSLAESEVETDPARAHELAAHGLDAGRRFRDPDLELAALGRVGLAEIWLGRVEEGMTRLGVARSQGPVELGCCGLAWVRG